MALRIPASGWRQVVCAMLEWLEKHQSKIVERQKSFVNAAGVIASVFIGG
jgi:hypothetical protein